MLYPFLKYWGGKSLKDWPEPLKRIVDMAVQEGHEEIIRNGNKYDAKILTAYSIDKVHGKKSQTMGLMSFFEYDNRESFENFYYTYIKGTTIPVEIEKRYIKGKQRKEIENVFNSLLNGKYPEDGFYIGEWALQDLFEPSNW